MESLVGKTISRYRIVEKLGQGGMGVVYKAEDSSLKRFVALKFLPGDLDENPERKIRFLREAQTAAALDHPNIATVYDIFEDDHYSFISIAFVEGVTLKQRILNGPLDIPTARHITLQIAAGLAAAHGKGIVHRDIKSANIMLKPDWQVKITDFGLAKLKGSSGITRSGAQIGTAAYMSPEQIQGLPADLRSDIFSLGVTLYEMLTGRFPFKGENDQAMMFSILYDTPAPLDAQRSDIPPALVTAVGRMLARDPDHRYQNAGEIVAAMNAIDAGSISDETAPLTMPDIPGETGAAPFRGDSPSTEAPPAPPTGPAGGGISRENWRKAAVYLLLLLLIAVAGIYFFTSAGTIPFTERDWILIVDFKNETEEPIFDRSLNTALSVSIGQSPFVNVFPRSRVQETLKRMKVETDRSIDESLAREIALREGIAVLLTPGISRVGSRYVLTAVLQDPATGKIFDSKLAYADDTDAVLAALDGLTRKIRRSLGETVASISERSRPLNHVTTSSLKALRQYSVADQLKRQANFTEARSFYEKALEIDSNFTAARSSLGILHVERAGKEPGFDRETGIDMIAKAVTRADELTDVEKYGILAYHADMVQNDLHKAVQYHKALLAIHPDLSNVHNNLAIVYRNLGQYALAVKEFQTAIRLVPGQMLSYNGLNIVYLYFLGEADSARVWARKQIAVDDGHFWAYHNLAWAYMGQDSLDAAEAALDRCREFAPEDPLLLYRLGHVYRMRGDYARAAEIFLRIAKTNAAEFDAYYQAGLVFQMAGETASALENFRRYNRLNEQHFADDRDNQEYLFNRALYEGRVGNRSKARSLAAEAFQVDTTAYFDRAKVLAMLGEADAAVDNIEKAITHGFRNYIWIKVHPEFIPLHENRRFQVLIKRLVK